MMLAYLAVSRRTNVANSSGVVGLGSAASRASVSTTDLDLSAAVNCSTSLASTGWGVPAGANKANQVLMSKFFRPGTAEAVNAGISGIKAAGLSVVTASALIFPSRMRGAAEARLSNMNCTSPLSKASCAGPAPR